MRLTKTDNINFTSKIICVSPNEFYEVVKKLPANSENIINWDIVPRPLITGEKQSYEYCTEAFGYRYNIANGQTRHVKSCTGGVIADKNNKQASLFLHLKNSEQNIDNLEHLDEHFKGTNAIFVGAKARFDNATELINNLIHKSKKHDLPTTYMKGLNFYHEINMAYSGPQDSLFLCIKNMNNKSYVKSFEDLKNVFNKIFTSSADKLEFGL